MTMEGRMTVCNMSIEMGARGGHGSSGPETTYAYIKGKDKIKVPIGIHHWHIGKSLKQTTDRI